MALRAYVLEGRPTEEAGAGLDQLMRELDRPQMSTLFAFSVELESGESRFVCAGHPPALIRHADGEVVELGTHEDLVAQGGRYAAMVATWDRHHT